MEIIECVRSAVDVSRLLGINAFSLDKLLATDPEFLVGGGRRERWPSWPGGANEQQTRSPGWLGGMPYHAHRAHSE